MHSYHTDFQKQCKIQEAFKTSTDIGCCDSLRVVKAASQEKSCYHIANIHVRNCIIMICDSIRFGLHLAQGHYFSIGSIHYMSITFGPHIFRS